MRTLRFLALLFTAVLALTVEAQGARDEHCGVRSVLSGLPVPIVQNRGIYPEQVLFYVPGTKKTVFFLKDGVLFRLHGQGSDRVERLTFVDADPKAIPQGRERRRATFSYFRGKKSDWVTGAPTFGKVVYSELWRGIDLVYRGDVGRLKYQFVVHRGGDAKSIRLRCSGAQRVTLSGRGGIRIATPSGTIEDAPAGAFQTIGGRRVDVEVAPIVEQTAGGEHTLRFEVGGYERGVPLVIDPAILVYCGSIGGSDGDEGHGVALDSQGNAYVTGWTMSIATSFPVTVAPT